MISSSPPPPDYYDALVKEALLASNSAEARENSHVVRVVEEDVDANNNNVVQVRVGNILSLLTKGFEKLSAAPVRLAAATLAVMDFNNARNNNSSFLGNDLKELTDDCDFYLTMSYRDPQYSPVKAGRFFQEEFLLGSSSTNGGNRTTTTPPRSMAVLGPIRSVESAMIATMGGSMPISNGGGGGQKRDKKNDPSSPPCPGSAGSPIMNAIPNISPRSKSEYLEDRIRYPYFARTTPTNRVDALALGWYLESIGVRRLAVLHAMDSYGRGYMLGLREAARQRGNIHLLVASYHDGLDESLKGAIDSLIEANYTYHMLIPGGGLDHWIPILYKLLDASLIGVEDKTWFLADALSARNRDLDDPRLARALNRTAVVHLTEPTQQARAMDDRVASFFENDELLEYFLSKQVTGPLAEIQNLTHFRSKYAYRMPSDESVLMTYDAVMALGIAACRAPQEFFTGPDLYESLKGVRFRGASGEISFDNDTATRPFANVSITNIIVETNGTTSGTGVESMVIQAENGCIETLSPLIFADGSTTPPPSLDPVVENMNLLTTGERATCWALAGIVLLLATLCARWTIVNRKRTCVRLSQPTFLFVLAVGSFIVGCSIIPATFQEPMSQRTLDAGCMSTVWLASVGFSTAFGGFWAKTRRIHHVFKESRRGRPVCVGVRDVLVPTIALLATNVALLVLWTVVAPLKWSRHPLSVDSYSRTTNSVGACMRCSDAAQRTFAALIAGINFVTLCVSNWMTYRARDLPHQFNDNPYIGIANMLLLECAIIGAPILFVTSGDPGPHTVVQSLLLALTSVAILLPVVLPFTLKPRVRDTRRISSVDAGKNFDPRKSRCRIRHYPSGATDSFTSSVYGASNNVVVTGLPSPHPDARSSNRINNSPPPAKDYSSEIIVFMDKSARDSFALNGPLVLVPSGGSESPLPFKCRGWESSNVPSTATNRTMAFTDDPGESSASVHSTPPGDGTQELEDASTSVVSQQPPPPPAAATTTLANV